MADHATQPHPDDQPVPVVDCALYKHGKRRAGTLPLTEAMDTARTSPDSFVWIGLREPTTDQLKVVADTFGLHPLAVEDAVHAHQRPKLERYDDSLFLVLKTVVYVEHDRLTPTSEVVSTGEITGLNQQVAELDKAIEARFRDHHTFDVITSMPGLGVILGAEFLAATGGD
ncbi:CorA family divalent cation transporter, partial [Streptomyces umbrinus]|uniref:CorA family divalent cation transporter n=1 Tax=Streptomyces umbrinus TaxID=67370 RepID=UPI003F4CFCF2